MVDMNWQGASYIFQASNLVDKVTSKCTYVCKDSKRVRVMTHGTWLGRNAENILKILGRRSHKLCGRPPGEMDLSTSIGQGGGVKIMIRLIEAVP